jgi:hypothetical protein
MALSAQDTPEVQQLYTVIQPDHDRARETPLCSCPSLQPWVYPARLRLCAHDALVQLLESSSCSSSTSPFQPA